MKIIDCIQGSPQWWKARTGIPTGSGIKRIITPKKGEYAAEADSYAAELIAASLGWESQFKGSPDTDRGALLERDARRWIKLQTGQRVREVGFCLSDCGRYGTSPDGLLEDGTPVEIKAPDLHTFIKWAVAGTIPDEHKPQCHMHMHVTGKDSCLFIAYTENQYLENIMIYATRDTFTLNLGVHLERFCRRLDELRRKLTGDEYEVLFPTQTATSHE